MLKIRLVYNDILSAANTFAQEGHETQQLYQFLNNAADELHGSGYIGKTADAFHRAMEQELLPATQRLAKLLERSAQTLKMVHSAFQSAEDESAGIFKKLFGS
jgi:WXG100 family type VII secretion target